MFRTAALAALFAAEGLQAAAPTVKDMNGRDSFPLGVNYAWVDWGRDFHSVGFEERFRRIQKDLDLMRSRGVRTLRWWVYTDFVESPLWKGTGKDLRCTGLPPGWVVNFLTVLEAAHERGIRLYPVFSSFDLGRKGFQAVVTHPPTRKSFIEKAVRPILEAAGKHPGVFAWDILNEPEWLVRKEDGGDPHRELSGEPVSLAELRAYLKDVAAEVHERAEQPVSVGSASLKWCGAQFDFYSGLGLDFFDAHFYDWMTPWFDVTRTPKTSLKLHPEYLEKPLIIGETMAKPHLHYTGPEGPKDHGRFLDDVIRMGYAGYLVWAWNERPDHDCSEAIAPHFQRARQKWNLP